MRIACAMMIFSSSSSLYHKNPSSYPWPRVRVFRGRGKGRRFLPAENPCHSLTMAAEELDQSGEWNGVDGGVFVWL